MVCWVNRALEKNNHESNSKGQKEDIENVIIKKLQSLLCVFLSYFNSNSEA